ncbi:MAG: elongation factor G [Rhodobiaceae bacterium]|nr:elongation factor G [Rhodobiaceae bacterium]
MGATAHGAEGGARSIAIVGPYLSGKTTLLEAILARTGAITRQGSVSAKNTVGDAAPEARAHDMSVEANIASVDFLGDRYTFVDCPGSIEFQFEKEPVLAGVDAAIVVCEPDEKKIPALQMILRDLEENGVPHMIFLNKIDKAEGRVRDMLSILQPASRVPMVLRQIPIWENGVATGYIDLALERAFVYREHAESEVIDIPADAQDRESEARYSMLEQLADYDDALMEQLLEDMEPPRDLVFEDLAKELGDGLICPVFIGSAEGGNGILRLLKAIRHEVGGVEKTAGRLGLEAGGNAVAQILKTIHTSHGGKLSVARVLSGTISDGDTLAGPDGASERIAGVFDIVGQEAKKRDAAKAGDTVAFGKLDTIATGATVTTGKDAPAQLWTVETPFPVLGRAVFASERKDEVKLTAAIGRIIDEDPSLSITHNQDTAEMVLHGQGEMHLRVALERLTGKYGIAVETRDPQIGYRETIRKTVTQRGRHKKQSGGHGQFGDVVIDIKPLPRGSGFEFSDTISGGVVPKQYIPAVEAGVREYMVSGPLGFPVVDIAVVLTDGSYHTVDSSEQAFKMAGRLAMAEGMPQCSSVLLEPIMHVEIAVPNDATAKINAIISSRRGQILGFDAREGWDGWDVIQAQMPEAELKDIIVELRSVSAGAGSFTSRFDHMAEISGRVADEVVAAHAKDAA